MRNPGGVIDGGRPWSTGGRGREIGLFRTLGTVVVDSSRPVIPMPSLRRFCLCVGLFCLLAIIGRGADAGALPFRNPDLPLEARVDDLLGRLEVREKIGLMGMDSVAVPRLGIPAYHWWNEALHGVARNGIATVFPQAIALAATWNTDLHHEIATVISTEARAKYNEAIARQNGRSRIYQGLTIWSPNINLFRDPRWGRGQETYGEDPLLTGGLGVAFVRGLQGEDPRYLKTVATVKHYAVHSGPESIRRGFNVNPAEQDLWDFYLPAFEMGIRAGAQSLMSAYNAVNGIPVPAHRWMLVDVLRDRWGFQGAVVGDVDTVADIWRHHKFAATPEEAAALAVKAGNDLCSGRTFEALPKALEKGLITEAELDVSLRRLLTLRFKLGQFDPVDRVPFSTIPANAIERPEHARLALDAARQSMVLLKNDGVLPLQTAQVKHVAILGPTGDDDSALIGNYAGKPANPITLVAGLKRRLEKDGVRVTRVSGIPLVEGFNPDSRFPPGSTYTDASRTTPGLLLEVFDNPELKGAPLSRVPDTDYERGWNDYVLAADVPEREASLRWSGVLVPPASGEYTFVLSANSGVKLQIGDKLVVDAWDAQNAGARLSAKVVLEAGQAYPIRYDYTQAKRPGGQVRLRWRMPASDTYADALAAARAADHVILTLGLTPDLEGEDMPVKLPGFVGGDKTSLHLPEVQRRLLADVAALGKPVTVVLTTGSALALETKQANAVICAWYYGQSGGEALAEIVTGDVNPSGRLPLTFYARDEDLPDFSDYSTARRTYRYFTGQPLFAFGHGLSYTTFRYEGLALSQTRLTAGQTVTAQVRVTNTGRRAGDEVVQVYARETSGRPGAPLKRLVGFARVSLEPGETKTVAIPVTPFELRIWDAQRKGYVLPQGEVQLAVGGASDRWAAEAMLVCNGAAVAP